MFKLRQTLQLLITSLIANMLKEAVVLLSLVCVAFAAMSIGPLEEKPKKFEGIEGCYFEALDAVVPFGQSAPSKTGCEQYTCGEKTVLYTSCGKVVAEVQPPCHVLYDNTKQYPECCEPTIKCD